MTALEFIEALRMRVLEADFTHYQNTLNSNQKVNDNIWKEALLLYQGLNHGQKKSLLKFTRLIEVNTISHLLGILDGSTFLSEKRESFKLIAESTGEAINGDLQDIFLEMEEM